MSTRFPSPEPETQSSRERLDIDFDEQLELAHRISSLDFDLAESPMAIPNREDIALRGVKIRVSPHEKSKSNLSLDIVKQQQGPSSVSVTITDGEARSSAAYNLLPSFNVWEEWHPGDTAPTKTITTSDFVNLLEPRLPKEHVFDQLMDRTPTGTEVAYMLARNLKGSARTRIAMRSYKITPDSDNPDGVETTITSQTVNSRTRRNLFIAATQTTDFGRIKKQYSYGTLFNPEGLVQAGGTVSFSTADKISKDRLSAFARRDQYDNYPVDSLNKGINTLRKVYKI